MVALNKRGQRIGSTLPPLDERQRELAGRYLSLAEGLAKRRSRACPWRHEDYHDAAIDGLIRAARDFDESRGILFSTMAKCYILFAIGNRAKYLGMCNRQAADSFVSIEANPDLDAPTTPARLADGEPDFDGLVASLPAREKLVVEMRYRDGRKLREIAKAIGRGMSQVRKIELKALGRLRERLVA
jgi:RNA polymerase sigma factor (sigma-70 family)